jgi:hypothetical protein
MDERAEEIIARAAALLAGGHSGTAETMLAAAMAEVVEHHRGSGSRAYATWVASLRALGETCISLAKRESEKARAYDG